MNSLEDKVDKQGAKWERIQKEEVELQNARLTKLEQYNLDLDKWKTCCVDKMTRWKEEVDIKNKEQRELDDQIRALVQKRNESNLAKLAEKVNVIVQTTSTNEEIGKFVEFRISEREHMKTCNLKRDNTHIIVSPLKKSRQTEGNSGLMPIE